MEGSIEFFLMAAVTYDSSSLKKQVYGFPFINFFEI